MAEVGPPTRIVEEGSAVCVSGDLDMVGGTELDRVLTRVQGDRGDVELDLGDVSFVDSTGLRSLLAANRRAGAGGGSLRIVAASPAVRRLLEITATADLFDLADAATGAADARSEPMRQADTANGESDPDLGDPAGPGGRATTGD